MKKNIQNRLFLWLFIIISVLTAVYFHPYFLKGQIPFPSNLLISSYSPWRFIKYQGFVHGAPNKAMGFDNLRQAYPNRLFFRQEILKGRLPLWNPYILSGTPFLAVFDPAVFYPLSYLFILLPPVDAWSILVIIQPVLVFIFMFLMLRSFTLNIAASIFGSFVFAFSGWMISYWQEVLILVHSFLWLPLAVYAVNRVWRDKKPVTGFLLLLLSLTFSVFAGFLQMTIYVYLTVFFWSLYLYFTRVKSQKFRLHLIFSAIAGSILVTSIQWLPSLEFYNQSLRGITDSSFLFRDFLQKWPHLLTLIAPDYWGNPGAYNYFGANGFYFEKVIYVGILPLIFAVYTLIYIKKPVIGFFKVLTLICLSLGFALPTSWLIYHLKIPILSASLPTRIFALSTFGMSVLSAYGFNDFLINKKYRNFVPIFILLSVTLIGLWIFASFTWLVINKNEQLISACITGQSFITLKLCKLITLDFLKKPPLMYDWYAKVSWRNLILPTFFTFLSIITVYSLKYSKKVFYFLTAMGFFAGSLYFTQKFLYFSERQFVYPETSIINHLKSLAGYNRVWEYGNAYIDKNIPSVLNLYSPDGYNGLITKRYAELLSPAHHDGRIYGVIDRSDADLKLASEKDPLGMSNFARLRLMSLLGVKYILEVKAGDDKEHKTTKERFPETLFKNVYEDKLWRIWEFKLALPRVFTVTDYEVNSNDNYSINRILNSEFDLGGELMLEEKPPFENFITGVKHDNQQDNSQIEIYEPQYVRIKSKPKSDSMIFLSDTYFPGWEAYLDGKPAKIYRANHSFRAVYTPAGEHIIEMIYRPKSLLFGFFITILGIFLVIGIYYVTKKSVK